MFHLSHASSTFILQLCSGDTWSSQGHKHWHLHINSHTGQQVNLYPLTSVQLLLLDLRSAAYFVLAQCKPDQMS